MPPCPANKSIDSIESIEKDLKLMSATNRTLKSQGNCENVITINK